MAKSKKPGRLVMALKEVGLLRIGILSSLGLIGAWFAFALAVSGIARMKNPPLALMFVGNDSAALAGQADQLFFANPKSPPKASQSLALDALREQALNPRALRILGYYADAQSKTALAERYVRMAALLSRREAGAQLWLVEASARKNDTAQTLIHYDNALRTAPDTATILFPRLLRAIEDRDIRTALKPYIRANDDWANRFLIFANSNSKNLPALVDLIVETGGLPDGKAAQSQKLALLERLVGEKFYAEARQLYLSMKGAQAAHLTNTAFETSDRFGPMVWQLLNDPDAGSSILNSSPNGDKGGALSMSVYANAATTRAVATKLLYLTPGNYTFLAKIASLNLGDEGFLSWQVRCMSDGSRDPFWKLDSISTKPAAAFTVASSCPVQRFDIVASGGTGQNGLEAVIANISISRQAQ